MKNRSLAGQGLGPRAWRDLVRLFVQSLAAGAFVSVVLALAVFIVATEAHASPAGGVQDGAPESVAGPLLALGLVALAAAWRRRRRGPAPLASVERTARAARQVC